MQYELNHNKLTWNLEGMRSAHLIVIIKRANVSISRHQSIPWWTYLISIFQSKVNNTIYTCKEMTPQEIIGYRIPRVLKMRVIKWILCSTLSIVNSSFKRLGHENMCNLCVPKQAWFAKMRVDSRSCTHSLWEDFSNNLQDTLEGYIQWLDAMYGSH